MPPKTRARGRPVKPTTEPGESASSVEDATEENVKVKRKTANAKGSVKSKADAVAPAEKRLHSFWLMKSEPESRIENGVDVKFGIEDLKALPNQTGCWDGVRNYQSRSHVYTDTEGKKNLLTKTLPHWMLVWPVLSSNQGSNTPGKRSKAENILIQNNYVIDPGLNLIPGICRARNFMRDMKVGQQAFFYHSNCKEPGIAGLMTIVKEAYVDHTQFDKKDAHYDASSKPENPKWSMVDVRFERMLRRFVPLSELKRLHLRHKAEGGELRDMALFTRARLSVQPLTREEFDFVLSLEDKEPL